MKKSVTASKMIGIGSIFLMLCSYSYGRGFTEPSPSSISDTLASDEIGLNSLIYNATTKTYTVPNPPTPGAFVKVKLPYANGATYNYQFVIDHSNVIFDCNYATLKGDAPGTTPLAIGIKIAGPDKKQIKNITVKNCKITGYNERGIALLHSFTKNVSIDPNFTESQINTRNQEIITNTNCAPNPTADRIYVRNCLRAVSPLNILLNNNYIVSSGQGVNIASYVKGAVIKNSTINNNVIGVHISYSSSNTNLLSSVLNNNGDRMTGSDREAVAIDSSFSNLISDNSFGDTYGVAVRVYKNCGESDDPNETGNTREDYSDYNTFSGNSFYLTPSFVVNDNALPNLTWDDNKLFKAISIADRQSLLIDNRNCSDPFYFSNNGGHTVRDYSKYNKIIGNDFKNYRLPIRVMDDENTLEDNVFLASPDISVTPIIHLGSNIRRLKGEPVTGIVVKRNTTEGSTVLTKCYGNASILLDGNVVPCN